MCLAIPMKIIKIEGNEGTVEVEGVVYTTNLQLLDTVNVGDYVLVHAGFAIEKVNEKHATETLKLLQEIANDSE